jgi:hypothetical protein
MGRRLFHWSGLCVAAGMAFWLQPAEAGEQKTEVGGQRTEMRAVRPLASNATFSPTTVFAAKATVTTNTPAGQAEAMAARKEKSAESQPASRPEHKTIKLFRFTTSKLGDFSVQPVVGGVKVAQLSFGF